MAVPNDTFSALPPLQRRMAEAWLTRFEESWDEGKLRECMRALPVESTLRRPLLHAMIERDLTRHWQHGQPITLNDYLREYPELGGAEGLPISLIVAEFQTRREHGGADFADFAARYPSRADELYAEVKGSLAENRDTPVGLTLAPVPEKKPLSRSASGVLDPAALKERRLRLLRGEPVEPIAPTPPTPLPPSARGVPAPAVSPPIEPRYSPNSADSVDLYVPPAPARSQPTQKLEINPTQTVWVDVQPVVAPKASESGVTGPPRSSGDLAISPAPFGSLPATLGHFQVQQKIRGAIYEAIDTRFDRRVALKIPVFEGPDAAAERSRFAREIRSAASLWHPLLCPIIEVGAFNGFDYSVMPLVEGEPLDQMLQRVPIWTTVASVELILKLATALDVAHRQGVIHRDLQPSNVIMTPTDTPVLVGFGRIARVAASKGSEHTSYLAPEQQLGSAEPVGPRSDVYSLGVLLYRLMSGRLPLSSGPMAFPASLDTGIRSLCQRATAQQPDDRFSSMREFASELSAWLTTHSRQTDAGPMRPLSSPGFRLGQSSPGLSGSHTEISHSQPGLAGPGTPPNMTPLSATGVSATFSQMQALRQLSDSRLTSTGNKMIPSGRVIPSNRWRWLLPAVIGGVALAATLFVLTRFFKPASSDPKKDPTTQAEVIEKVPLEKLLIDLKDPDPEKRRLAAETIRLQREMKSVKFLVDRVSDRNWDEPTAGRDKKRALEALRELSPVDVPKALHDAVYSEQVAVRIWACKEIFHDSDMKMVSAVVACLQDDDARVRIAALVGIRDPRWNQPDIVNELAKLLGDKWVSKPRTATDEDYSDPKNSGRADALDLLIRYDRKLAEQTLKKLSTNADTNVASWASKEHERQFSK